MLARYLRIMLLLELAAYAAIAEWLHFLFAWSYGVLAVASLAAVLLGRLAMVGVTTTIGWANASPRTREHQVGIAGGVRLVLREWLAVTVNNLFHFPWEAYALRRDPVPTPGTGVPVVMIHGYFSNRGYFRQLVRSLESRGVAPIHTPNFSGTFTTIERFAAELHDAVERICAGSGEAKVVLVCHSMGGLGARTYLCRHGAARVAKLITIASPHHGTVHARFGAGDNARQMLRGSPFLAELCAKEGSRGPECGAVSIYTPHDNLVAPQETSRLPWAKNIAIPGRGHVDILRSPELVSILLGELEDCREAKPR